MPNPFPTWSTTMRAFFAACRRLHDIWALDLIGVAVLFGLIPLILSLGGAR